MAVSIAPRVNPLRAVALGRELDDREQRTQLLRERQNFVQQRAGQQDRANQQASAQQREVASYELGMQLLQLPDFQTFQQALPLAVQTGLLDEEDMAVFSTLTAENYTGQAKKAMNAATEHFNTITKDFTPKERALAARVEAGIAPRAMGNAATTIAAGNAGATADEVADVTGTIEGGKKAGGQSIEVSGEMFEQLGNINSSLQNYDQAIAAIDEGASSGVIASRFPSIKAASVSLDNAQRRMGLDVIAQGKFGPLSEGEMFLALETALPPLPPAALKDYLIAKRDAQIKFASELRKAAIFLGKPGNTLADFLENQEIFSEQPEEDVVPESDVTILEFDAQGNPIADSRETP